MAGDFVDYGCDTNLIYKIQGGVDKTTSAPIVISTWQSLIRQPKEWFDQFRVVLGDEAHLFQAKSLTTIMEKLTDAPYRHGFTGTISSESKVHRLILEGVFGPIKRFVTTKQLMDEGTVADFKVKALVLQHDKESKDLFVKTLKDMKKKNPAKKNMVYAYEKEFLFSNEKRNNYIQKLVHSLDNQNNLILFDWVEKHGKILEPLLRKEGRILHFIYGNTPGEERERIRHLIENDPLKRHDILASYGVFSTGVSIKRIDNAIFASAYKAEIKTLQSIGRTLRKGNGSDKAILYDITDDLTVGSFTNYTLQHFRRRIEIYAAEQFPFKIYNIDL
jgi:superfamily II DNA or RNA helicase